MAYHYILFVSLDYTDIPLHSVCIIGLHYHSITLCLYHWTTLAFHYTPYHWTTLAFHYTLFVSLDCIGIPLHFVCIIGLHSHSITFCLYPWTALTLYYILFVSLDYIGIPLHFVCIIGLHWHSITFCLYH